jgi:hypothetical protein
LEQVAHLDHTVDHLQLLPWRDDPDEMVREIEMVVW